MDYHSPNLRITRPPGAVSPTFTVCHRAYARMICAGGEAMEKIPWKDRTALERFQMIAPILDETLETDKARKSKLILEIAEKSSVDKRTIYRYLKAYKEEGFEGLRPADHGHGSSRKLSPRFDELFEEAKVLKTEVPERSVNDIIKILVLEDRAEPGELKRSTLQKHLFDAGLSRRQLSLHNENRTNAARRFCKKHRMELIQCDIKYSSSHPVKIGGKKKTVYLSTLLDDHSRFPLASRWFPDQTKERVEFSFREAILKYGLFDKAYVDRGGQYISKNLIQACARLGIVVRHTPVRSGKSKGKVEKLHQVVDKFLLEASLKEYENLEAFNFSWEAYLELNYVDDPHEGLEEYYKAQGVEIDKNDLTPRKEFMRDSRELRFADASVVREAFLKHKSGRVTRGATVSVEGNYYGVDQSCIGSSAEIIYDTSDLSNVIVKCPGREPMKCPRVKIGEYVDPKQPIPAAVQSAKPTTSRMLDAMEKKYGALKAGAMDAISYSSLMNKAKNKEEEH